MEALKALMKDFDPAALMPNLSDVLDKLENIIRLAVMIAPLVLLGLGLLYLLAAPKEANYKLGYRFFWGMSSVEAWQFTQKTAGLVWTGLGLGMTVAMSFICNSYRDMAWEAMLFSALISVVAELLLVFLSTLLINALVILHFARKGTRRSTREEQTT